MAKNETIVREATQNISSAKGGNTAIPSAEKKGQYAIITGIGFFLLIISLIVVLLGSVFYFIIKNDFNGFAQKYRTQIAGIPVLKTALPKPADPENPKNMTQDELEKKYNELRAKRDELLKSLDDANKTNAELQKYKDNQDQAAAQLQQVKSANDAKKVELDQLSVQLAEEKKILDEMIASGDKTGFKSYFEKVDKETAKEIYEKIINEQKSSDAAVKFTQVYESMEPGSAAQIFQKMGETQMQLIVETLKNMKKENASAILSSMDASFAAKVTESLSAAYKQ